ncbi:MAG: S-layer glycoprotein N-glycosyltransferase AglJ [Methanosarcinaceae archaeon]|jgi:dolichol-phosphate mannosyltransferase|nr:S-layer glycoprotein N-glycosyltransferase AglJ [Methanosarcinaceae archaeon]NKQ37931.1 S-layer glycoprotein N-glycosyltransferase AglJ [Methanosarcinales archaeon]
MSNAKSSNDNVCILLPTLNEENTIKNVINDFKSEGFYNILVIDGNSKDKTQEVAKASGAKVIIQSGKGKGQAVIEAFDFIEDDFIVMADGDGTYQACDIHAMLKPIFKNGADHVIGNRFKNYEKGAFTRLNLFGNNMINRIFRFVYGEPLHDILSGYRAFTKNTIKSLHLKELGFEIESEIAIECIKNNLKTSEVPITYLSRHPDDPTKLNPLRDGFKIGIAIYELAKTHNPLFYFGIIGSIFIIMGTGFGVFVVYEWLHGVTRVLLTILSSLFILFGFQMFMVGLIGEMNASFNRDLVKRIQFIIKNQK